jgi:hypothetical protein
MLGKVVFVSNSYLSNTFRLFKNPPIHLRLTLVRLDAFHSKPSVLFCNNQYQQNQDPRRTMSDQRPNALDQATCDTVLAKALIALVDCGEVYAAQAKEATRKIEVLKSRYPPGLSLSSWPKPSLEDYRRYLGQAQFYWQGQLDLTIPRAHLHFQAGFTNLIADENQLHGMLTEKLRVSKQLQDLVGQLISMAEERE